MEAGAVGGLAGPWRRKGESLVSLTVPGFLWVLLIVKLFKERFLVFSLVETNAYWSRDAHFFPKKKKFFFSLLFTFFLFFGRNWHHRLGNETCSYH